MIEAGRGDLVAIDCGDGEIRCVAAVLDDIAAWSARAYPVEACGVLLGERAETLPVLAATLAANVAGPEAERRFEMDPGSIVFAEIRAQLMGLEVVGFWHSHPGGTLAPSALDRELAWPGFVQLICAVSSSGTGDFGWYRAPAQSPTYAAPLRAPSR